MTELAEPVAIGIIAAGNDKNEPCWFCEEPPAGDLVNDETADPDTTDGESEAAVPENDEHNDSSKLGANLGKPPTWTIPRPDGVDASTTVAPGAHHCIPGNASLKKATALHRFMRKDGPFSLASDIGYDVNADSNGVWLPANYAIRPGNEDWEKWSTYSNDFKNLYAKSAMEKSRAQFHDAHPEYSKNVLKTLTSLAQKLGKPADKCPVCEKKYDKTRPPYGLVGRLNGISRQHSGMLEQFGERTRKFVAKGYFTSSRVKSYFGID